MLIERAGRALDDPAWAGAARSVADELLVPSVLYAPAVLAAIGVLGPGAVKAAAHITGGGIPGNLARALPGDCDAVVDRPWERPALFDEIQRLGDVADDEMARVFNLGVGMVLVVSAEAAGRVVGELAGAGRPASVVGQVVEGAGDVVFDAGRRA